ncbi:unnamed protein product [Sphagnum jensenii]
MYLSRSSGSQLTAASPTLLANMKSDSSYVLGLLLSLDSRLLCRSRLNLHITVQMRHAGQFKLFSTPAPSMSTDPQMACTIRISHLNLLNASRMHANISNGRLCTSDPLQCLSRCLCSHSLETNPYVQLQYYLLVSRPRAVQHLEQGCWISNLPLKENPINSPNADQRLLSVADIDL